MSDEDDMIDLLPSSNLRIDYIDSTRDILLDVVPAHMGYFVAFFRHNSIVKMIHHTQIKSMTVIPNAEESKTVN